MSSADDAAAAVAEVATSLLTELDAAQQLEALAAEYYRLRAATSQPMSPDDVPRCERPVGWAPDFSEEALASMLRDYEQYLGRFRTIIRDSDVEQWSREQQVDAAVVMAHLERLRWEQTVLRASRRNPDFFITQTLGAIQEVLVGANLLASPSDPRLSELLVRLQAVPRVLEQGQALLSLGEAEGEFAVIALSNLEGRDGCCRRVIEAISTSLNADWPNGPQFLKAADEADVALQNYRSWLAEAQPTMRTGKAAVGREGFEDFLSHVALVSWFSIEDMLNIGDVELRRTQAMTTIEENRNRAVPERHEMTSIAEQEVEIAQREQQIRDFVERKDILTIPDWLGTTHLAPIPSYLEPLFGLYSDNNMMTEDDISGVGPMSTGLTRFSPPPDPDKMGFFPRSCIYDPRPQICHESIPGHQTQLAISQRHGRPIRRKYLDSVSNEGIGTYLEEMLLHAGLFDDNPHTRADIWRYYRLRVLRISTDLNLGCGLWDIPEGADYLEKNVPMDKGTAEEDAWMYLATPGLGLSYGIGKAQIMRFLALARQHHDDSGHEGPFDLRGFHDSLWLNGNVPIELQAYELLGGEPPPAIKRLIAIASGSDEAARHAKL